MFHGGQAVSSSSGWAPDEALSRFGNILTEFEKSELNMYKRVYTLGRVRRFNQYSICN